MFRFVSRLMGRGSKTETPAEAPIRYQPFVEELEPRNLMAAGLSGALAPDFPATPVRVSNDDWAPRPSIRFDYDVASW